MSVTADARYYRNKARENMDIEKQIEELKKSFTLKELGADGIFYFVASKQVRDRDSDLIYCGPNEKGQGILTDEFDKNPVFLAHHDDKEFPIGKVVSHKLGQDSAGIPTFEIGVLFAETDDGQEAKYLYENGFMSAVSIRFRPMEYMFNDAEGGYDVFTCRLYEVSAVSIPANQEALIIKGWKAEKELDNIKMQLEQEALKKKLNDIKKNLNIDGIKADKYQKALENILTAVNAIK